MKISKLIIGVFVVLMFSSCSSEENLAGDNVTEAVLHVTCTVPPSVQASSRTGLADVENTVSDLSVMVYDNNGYRIGQTFVTNPPTTESGGTKYYSLEVPARQATGCTIVVIANTRSQSALDAATTLAALKKWPMTIAKADDLGSYPSVPMSGFASGVNIDATQTTIDTSITLARLCSKMQFKITPSAGITITGYQLCNVLASGYFDDTTTPSSYLDFDAVTNNTTSPSNTYWMFPNPAGTNINSSTALLRNSTNAPAGATYLLVNAQGDSWKSTYRIYLGGTSNNDYSNFNVPRNYNYTYNININGSGNGDARVNFTAKLIANTPVASWTGGGSTTTSSTSIGQYLFNDGTIGTIKDNPKRLPVALIFSDKVSYADSHLSTPVRYYAMALQNANNNVGVYWSSIHDNAQMNELARYSYAINDLDGRGHVYTYSSDTNYPAFNCAYAYHPKDSSGNSITFANTNAQSDWFMPSEGQWFQILQNLGMITEEPTRPETDPDPSWAHWKTGEKGSTKNYPKIFVDNVNSYLKEAATVVKVDCFDVNDVYWSSTEYNTTNAYRFYMNEASSGTSGVISMGTNDKVANYKVRPVICIY